MGIYNTFIYISQVGCREIGITIYLSALSQNKKQKDKDKSVKHTTLLLTSFSCG
jgi:hypothetical protein